MFSDSRNYPPACIKVKCLDKVPSSVDRSWKGLPENSPAAFVDVGGAHRHLFYRRPNVSALSPVVVQPEDEKESEDPKINDVKSEKTDLEVPPKSRNFGVQTDYRESETQTVPYSPDVVVRRHSEEPPIVLTLENLKWGQGIPPGLHEIENIEWEINHREVKAFLMDPNNIPENKRPAALEYIHREEWLHREKEIQEIHDLRMELAEKMMQKRGEDLSSRRKEIVKRKYESKLEENWKKLTKIRETHRRELRKLINKQKGISMKYKRPDPITEQADYSSELYGPLMRHGVDPRRRHEVPLSLRSKFLHDYKGLGILEQATTLMKTPELVPLKEKPVLDDLCDRSTRWSDEQLILLQKYFKGLMSELEGTETKSIPKLMVSLPKPSPRPVTPTMEGIPESEEKLYQAAVFMQKMIRGRAIQMLMFKGKKRSQDLINELQTTHSVLSKGQNVLNEEKMKTLLEYQDELEEKRKEEAYENMLSMLVGDTVGAMLDFLAKELVRLKDERCIHALLLLAQRERHRREAEEAGRRQVEERRRREHDEVFKQAVKVHQETVDVYLEDIVLNAMEWVATAESRSYIKELARKIDYKTKDLEVRENILECKDLVTDIVYDFMLPEVYKEMLDQNREKEQKEYLRTIQDEVYKTLTDPEREYQQLPHPKSEEEEEEQEDEEYEPTGEEDSAYEREDEEIEEEQHLQTIEDDLDKILSDSEGIDQQTSDPRTEEEEQGDIENEYTEEEEEIAHEVLDQERGEGQEDHLGSAEDDLYKTVADPEKEYQQSSDVRTDEEDKGDVAYGPSGEEENSAYEVMDQVRGEEHEQHLGTTEDGLHKTMADPELYQQSSDQRTNEEEKGDVAYEPAGEEENSVYEVMDQVRGEEHEQHLGTTEDGLHKTIADPELYQQSSDQRTNEEEKKDVVHEPAGEEENSVYGEKWSENSQAADEFPFGQYGEDK